MHVNGDQRSPKIPQKTLQRRRAAFGSVKPGVQKFEAKEKTHHGTAAATIG
jgi:hypothetical protein